MAGVKKVTTHNKASKKGAGSVAAMAQQEAKMLALANPESQPAFAVNAAGGMANVAKRAQQRNRPKKENVTHARLLKEQGGGSLPLPAAVPKKVSTLPSQKQLHVSFLKNKQAAIAQERRLKNGVRTGKGWGRMEGMSLVQRLNTPSVRGFDAAPLNV